MRKYFFIGLLFLTLRTEANANVINDTEGFVTVGGSTSTNIVAAADIGFFDAYQAATVQVLGGKVSWLTLHDYSSVRVTGVDSLSWLLFDGSTSRAEIVANDVQYTNGHLSGIWGNGTPFEFWALNLVNGHLLADNMNMMPSNILITSVPEPEVYTMMLAGLGIVGFVARRKQK